MQQGLQTDERVESLFLVSTEYFGVRYGGDLQRWVAGMYTDLLRRTASQAEVDRWVRDLQAGRAKDSVSYAITSSPERERLRVIDNYMTLLGRAASQSEIDSWVGRFVHGLTNEQMIAGFVGSPEYYYRAEKGRGNKVAWISHAYQDVLFRVPSVPEVQNWLRFLG
jgi:hypothetical protein